MGCFVGGEDDEMFGKSISDTTKEIKEIINVESQGLK